MDAVRQLFLLAPGATIPHQDPTSTESSRGRPSSCQVGLRGPRLVKSLSHQMRPSRVRSRPEHPILPPLGSFRDSDGFVPPSSPDRGPGPVDPHASATPPVRPSPRSIIAGGAIGVAPPPDPRPHARASAPGFPVCSWPSGADARGSAYPAPPAARSRGILRTTATGAGRWL